MHLLTKLTEDWLVKNCMYGTNWNTPSLYRWESEVLLPWLKEQEDAWKKASLINLTNGQELWGIVKRKEQAEWFRKQYPNNNSEYLDYNIDQAFGLTEEKKQESCEEEMLKNYRTDTIQQTLTILAQRIDRLERK